MTQPNILDAAKQGNPKAIAALMNRALQPKEITVTAKRAGDKLHIMLESLQALNQQALVAYVSKGIASLEPESIKSIVVYGRRKGDEFPAWTERATLTQPNPDLDLQEAPVAESAVVPGSVEAGQKRQGRFLPRSPIEWIGLMLGIFLLSLYLAPSWLGKTTQVQEEPVAPSTPVPSTPASTPLASQPATKLPSHTVSETSLGNGKRIQVDTTNPKLSQKECLALAERYLNVAGVRGQVVVQRPNPKPPFNGKLLPLCVNNLDGEGTFSTEFYFQ